MTKKMWKVVSPIEKKDGTVAYDLRGQFRDLNLREFPKSLSAPRATSQVSGDYHVVGKPRSSTRRATDVSSSAWASPIRS